MVYSDYTESIWRAILSTSQRSPYLFLYYNLFLLVVISRGIFANFEPKITYISYSRSIEVDESPVSIDLLPNRTDFQILEEVDDSPFETYELPWPIQVFGRSLKYGFLSSNGALHLYNDQPCQGYFGYTGCTFNTSYYNVVAGVLLDLYPGNSTSVQIAASYNFSAARVDFYYVNVPFWGMPSSISFRISLFSDSKIQIFYDKIDDVHNKLKNEPWITGLRANKSYSSHLYYSAAQLSQKIEYATTIPGIYPSKSTVASSSTFIICPISTIWSSKPAKMDLLAASSSLTETNLTLSSLSISCYESVTFGLIFSSLSSFIPCVRSKSSVDHTIFNCSIGNVLLGKSFPDQKATFRVAWSTFGGNDYNIIDGIQPIIIRQAASKGECFVNFPSGQGESCKKSYCNMLSGNYTCFQSVCDAAINPVPGYYYVYPTCKSSCSLDEYSDDYGNCCMVDQMDCRGKCFGTAVIAKDFSHRPICCNDNAVDCAGFCGGRAKFDACGTCGGAVSNIKGCPFALTIETGQSDSSVRPQYDLSYPPADRNSINSVNFTNLNASASIKMYFTISPISLLVPQVDVSQQIVLIPPNSSYQLLIRSSISYLYNISTNVIPWTTKKLIVKFHLDPPSKDKGNSTIEIVIYPMSVNCNVFSYSESQCSVAPGCTYCILHNDIRLLREEYSDDVNFVRRLYNNIAPFSAGRLEVTQNRGICVDGIDQSSCLQDPEFRLYSSSSSVTNIFSSSKPSIIVVGWLHVIIVLFLSVCVIYSSVVLSP